MIQGLYHRHQHTLLSFPMLLRLGVAQQVSTLFLLARCECSRGIIKETIRGHRRHEFCCMHLFIDLLYNCCNKLLVLFFTEHATAHQEALETQDGVLSAPGLDLLGLAIARGIICSGMLT